MKKRPAKTVTAKVQTQPMAAANTAKAAETKVTEKAPEVKAEVKTEVKAEAEAKIAEKVNEVAEKAAEIAVEKAAETKTAVKAAAKKTAEKVGTAKKAAAAKKAEKAPLIPEIKIQFAGNEADEDEIVNAIRGTQSQRDQIPSDLSETGRKRGILCDQPEEHGNGSFILRMKIYTYECSDHK